MLTPSAHSTRPYGYAFLLFSCFAHLKHNFYYFRSQIAPTPVADRKTVYPARYGSDEFVIIYTKINIFQVRSIIETIHNNIHKLHLKHEFSPIAKYVTVSQGAVCGIPKQEQTIRYYMNRADETLYEVKIVGKNNFGVSPVNREHI